MPVSGLNPFFIRALVGAAFAKALGQEIGWPTSQSLLHQGVSRGRWVAQRSEAYLVESQSLLHQGVSRGSDDQEGKAPPYSQVSIPSSSGR